MHFTEGQLRQYESLMQEKPGYDRKSVKIVNERECNSCQKFDENYQKCNRTKCLVFDD